MSDPQQPQSNAIPGPRWALALGLFFLALLTLAAATVVADRHNRGQLEKAVEETAVGDTEVQVIGDRRINHHTVEAVFNGVPLYFAYLKEVKVDDRLMRAIGRDDQNRYTIYQPQIERLQIGHHGQQLYYIKRKPNKYAQLHAHPREMLPPITADR